MRKNRYFSCMRPALVWLAVLSLWLSISTAKSETKERKIETMSIANTSRQVAGHLEAFRKTGELTTLRNAANLIDSIQILGTEASQNQQTARAAKLSLWLELLDTMDCAKDPTFDPEDMPAARVILPSGTRMKPGVPLVTPEGIADIKDRRKYDEAVRANAEKTKRYRLQKELRQLDAELTSRADTYITGAYLRSPQGLKEINAAIAGPVHNQDRAAHLRSLVLPR